MFLANLALLPLLIALLPSFHLVGQIVAQPYNNSLTLKLIPGLLAGGDQTHAYYVVAHCKDSEGNFCSGGNFAYAENCPNDEANLTLKFGSAQLCPYYETIIWMVQMPYETNAWPSPYVADRIPNDGLKKRIMFGNFFNLSIGPTLETEDLFYHVRVFCDDEKVTSTVEIDEEKTVEKWTVSDDYGDYKFKTFTKGTPTKVVFNSEKRQCDKYHIKVWERHADWINNMTKPEERPMAYFVCESRGGNGEHFQISMLQHFKLEILPPLSTTEEEENIYFVEVQCHNFEAHTFKTFTKSKTDVVLNRFNCKSYDISVREVRLNWAQRMLSDYGEVFKKAIYAIKPLRQLAQYIAKGATYQLEFPARYKRRKIARFTGENDGGGIVAKQTDNEKQIGHFIYISDDEQQQEEKENEQQPQHKEQPKKSEMKENCYFYYNF